MGMVMILDYSTGGPVIPKATAGAQAKAEAEARVGAVKADSPEPSFPGRAA